MVNTCCVPGCRTGYKSVKATEKIALFRFPKEDDIRQQWIEAIPRQNWKLSDCHRVCAKHFHEHDFQHVSADQRLERRISRDSQALKNIRLKRSAVPRVFHDLPKYQSTAACPSAPRSTTASTAASRRELENIRIEQQNQVVLNRDTFDSFASFVKKLKDAVLPDGYSIVLKQNAVLLYYIRCSDVAATAPQLLVSVVVAKNLAFKAYVNSVLVPSYFFKHLLSSGSLKQMSELSNILALCKSLLSKSSLDSSSNSFHIGYAVASLEHYVSSTELVTENDSACQLPLLQFIIGQLKMLQEPQKVHQYSTALITTAFLWQSTSSSLYKKLREFFILPSISTLRKFSSCSCSIVDTLEISVTDIDNVAVD